MVKDNEFREGYVTRVIDGDTFEAIVDLKYHASRKVKFRLLDVDTAEKNEPKFEEAKRFTMKNILHKTIHIYNPKEKVDGFGRYLCHVWYENGEGEMIKLNDELLVQELAKKYKK
jgi:endonuclease YncB( thermonuclease family)